MQISTGDLIAYIDDDIVFTSKWVEGILESFSDPSVALCGGPTSPLLLATPPSWLDSFWYEANPLISILPELSLSRTSTPCILEIDPQFIFGLNFVIRKQVLVDAGGFHPDCVPGDFQHFQGDGETGLGKKIQQLGFKAVYHHEVRLLHQIDANRLTIEYFENRYFYQGVCDSYTSIRAAGGKPKEIQNSTETIRPSLIGRVLKRIQKQTTRQKRPHKPNDISIVKQRCQAAYERGFSFHQECARRSKRLCDWIMRPDYFDYTYPKLEDDYVSPKRQPTLSY